MKKKFKEVINSEIKLEFIPFIIKEMDCRIMNNNSLIIDDPNKKGQIIIGKRYYKKICCFEI